MSLKEQDFGPFPFRDMPYRSLTEEQRSAAGEDKVKAETIAQRLLGPKININIFIPGRLEKLELMGATVNEVTGYRGATVVVEKWQLQEDGKGKSRDFSFAFYPDLVLNRPNMIAWFWINEGDEIVVDKEEFTGPDEHPVFGKQPETYEAGKEELENLVKVLEHAEIHGVKKDGFFESGSRKNTAQ